MSDFPPKIHLQLRLLTLGTLLLLAACAQPPREPPDASNETPPFTPSDRLTPSWARDPPESTDSASSSTPGASDTTKPGSHDELTARDLQIIFETRAPLDDPSHHGALFSSEPMFSRDELESADRRLVAVPKERGNRPNPRDSVDAARQRPGSRQVVRSDETFRDFDGSCLRSGCHQTYAQRPWVHKPVKLGSCDACHIPDEEASEEHRFAPTHGRDNLCAECHEHSAPEKYQHTGYTDSDCVKCHDPHGGANEFYLISFDQRLMCGQCHGSEELTAQDSDAGPLHKPVAEMRCLSCHAAHRSNYAAITIAPTQELCMQCHEEFVAQLSTVSMLHEPVSKNCGACHLSHGGRSHMIRSRSQDLCLDCHGKIAATLEQETLLHAAIKGTRSCLDCHVPHASYTEKLLKGRVGATCITCHDEVIEAKSGRKIPNIKQQLLTRNYRHAPALEGQCQECHVAHSLEKRRLLAVDYPTQLYMAGEAENYALCLNCHDPRLLSHENTTVTRFRDGTRNLHRVHVIQKKGRTCNTCHEVHAADVPALMRKNVRFGSTWWVIEIGFERTQTGGTCGANCHQEMSYANVDPPGDDPPVKYRLREP